MVRRAPDERRVVVTEWLAVVIDAAGQRQFLSAADTGFTRYPGNAVRYATEDAALHEAYMQKESFRWIVEVGVEPNTARRWVKGAGGPV